MKPSKKFFGWPQPFQVDLANPNHRFKIAIGFAVLIVLGLGIVVGGVNGYLWTESTEFCGTLCHSMYPQMTRYEESPHNNVECVHCHVGDGLVPFVQSKIDGTRQLIGTITNDYSRPILSPVHNLRPARETCENCHTPTSFKDNITKTIKHYGNDVANSPSQTTLVLKLGGINTATGQSKGIHWHIQSEVYYIPMDRQRQVIGWIGIKQEDGSLKEFYASDLIGMGKTEFVKEAQEKGEMRKLDCIDCHNRAAHYIPNPGEVVDKAISDGLISRDLPSIRGKAVSLLTGPFETTEAALSAIESLGDSYRSNSALDQTKVELMVATLKDIFERTNFPDMKLDFTTNPNNANHAFSLGCFRCHDGNHVTSPDSGEVEAIRVECNLCHTVPIVGTGEDLMVEAPVIIGEVPETHTPFSWTITHQSISEEEKNQCYLCHGQAFCNNGACHNLEHPEDMAYTHAVEANRVGQAVCFTCHQDVTCAKCHPGGVTGLRFKK